MILCRDDAFWYCSTGVSRDKDQCGVRCGSQMAQPDGLLPLPPAGAQRYGLRPFRGIRFFPEIRYRGCKVYPEWWHRESSEPLLAVLLLPSDLELSKFFVRPPAFGDLQRAMEADGWHGDGREGWHKYVHVDELEKIEGPPPEGPF